jgi:hypothetical protein
MKALRFLTLAAALTVAGCNDSNPTPPTDNNPPPGQQTTTESKTYNLNMKTGNERPAAITGAEAYATGTATI